MSHLATLLQVSASPNTALPHVLLAYALIVFGFGLVNAPITDASPSLRHPGHDGVADRSTAVNDRAAAAGAGYEAGFS